MASYINICWPLLFVLAGFVLLLIAAVGLVRKRDSRGSAMDLARAEHEFRKLKTQFEAGNLDEAQFKARLADLMLQDEQGHWWMIGYETGQWYRHEGEQWVRSDPPASRYGRQAAPTGLWLLGSAGLILLALGIVAIAENLGLFRLW
jgi:multisubunit Na+/H+ antiporter MnhG subunit